MSDAVYERALAALRLALAEYQPGGAKCRKNAAARGAALVEFQPIFSPDHISSLTAEEYRLFLRDKHNRHWRALHRGGTRAVSDMNELRKALCGLLDEHQPIADRFAKALGKVKGLGKGIATAILTVAYPDKYGVWNETSMKALRQLGIWPEFRRGGGIGGQYVVVNELLDRLRRDLETDFWTLDLLWFYLPKAGAADRPCRPSEQATETRASL